MQKWRSNSWRLKNFVYDVISGNKSLTLLQFIANLSLWILSTSFVHSQEILQNELQSRWNYQNQSTNLLNAYAVHRNRDSRSVVFEQYKVTPNLFWTRPDSRRYLRRLEEARNGRNRFKSSYRMNKQRRFKWRGLLSSTEESFEEKQNSRHKSYKSEEDSIVDSSFEDCSLYPNNTFNAPFAFACEIGEEEEGIAPPAIVVHEAAFSNETGDYVYPLDLTQTLRIFLDLTSFATRRYDNMRTEVTVYRRQVGWLGCGWSFVPTFGTLDMMEICDESNPSCPVYPGRQVLEIKMASRDVLTRVLRVFHDDRVPYQLRVRVFNNRRLGEELFCVTFQARIDV